MDTSAGDRAGDAVTCINNKETQPQTAKIELTLPLDACMNTASTMEDMSVTMEGGTTPKEGLGIWEDPVSAEKENENEEDDEKKLNVDRVPRPYLSIQVGDEDYAREMGQNENKNSQGHENVDTAAFLNTPKEDRGNLTPPASKMSNKSDGWPFASPSSCRSIQSRASQMEFGEADQTIILLDWDDTLCPSTYCMKTHKLGVMEPLPEHLVAEMSALEDIIINIIDEACEIGCVVIVTNAEEGWIELSAKAWLPRVYQSIWQKCKVVSARSKWEPQGITSPAGWKQKAFYEEIDGFYSRYEHQSWKNVISVGDAPHERDALFRVTLLANASNRRKQCRVKAIKFMIRPTIAQLMHELGMLRRCLKQVVGYDDHLDLQFDENSLPENLMTGNGF